MFDRELGTVPHVICLFWDSGDRHVFTEVRDSTRPKIDVTGFEGVKDWAGDSLYTADDARTKIVRGTTGVGIDVNKEGVESEWN